MDITPELHETAPLISKYGNGGFVIANTRQEGSIAISAQQSWPLHITSIDQLETSMLSCFLESDIQLELILFGCGLQAQPLPSSIRQTLDARQIGYDVMDTGAACRTFNILLGEDRLVGTVLMAV